MGDLAGDRVYAERSGASQLLVASSPGLVVVSLSGDRVGEFGLVRRCAPADVATAPAVDDVPARLAVATDEDVLVAADADIDGLEPAGFGPAAAVTFEGDRIVAAAPDGRVAVSDGERWMAVGSLPTAPTTLDGDLAGTVAGVFRLTADGLRPAGLQDVADIAHSAGVPLVATADGLYRLGNGWLDVLAGDFALVAGARDGRAHAATATVFHERAAGEWPSVDLPVSGPVAAVAYGETTYAVTTDGDLLVRVDDGWRSHPLGLDGVVAATEL